MWVNLRKYFVSGLMVFMPLALTVFLFIWVIGFADGLLGDYIQPFFKEYFGFYIPGLGILVGVMLIIMIGFFATQIIGAKFHGAFEKLFLRLPFFKQVYPAFKEIVGFFFSRERPSFKKAVIVQYPSKGIYSFGFLTNETSQKLKDLTGEDLCNVFVSSSPSPFTGFAVMIPKKDIIMTDISIEEAAKFIVSGGVVNPHV